VPHFAHLRTFAAYLAKRTLDDATAILEALNAECADTGKTRFTPSETRDAVVAYGRHVPSKGPRYDRAVGALIGSGYLDVASDGRLVLKREE